MKCVYLMYLMSAASHIPIICNTCVCMCAKIVSNAFKINQTHQLS